jgi:hypothetical protein
MKTLKRFLIEQQIEEALKPKETSYGTNFPDFDNKKWENTTYIGFALTSTIFTIQDRYVVVDITKDNNIIFRTYPKTSSIKSSEDVYSSASWDKSKKFVSSVDAADVLQKVMYTALPKIKQMDKFFFLGEYKLASLYRRLVSSKSFVSLLDSYGFKIEKETSTLTDFKVEFTKNENLN